MADYWGENLLEASIGYVEVPVEDRRVGVGRNFARYTFAYRDGQGGEDLGRKVYQFTLTLPLYRGVDESLYPDAYQRLLAIIEDPEQRAEVEYVDPEFGPMNCKVLDYDISTPGTKRNGVTMVVTLEELGFDASAIDNLTRPNVSGEAEALSLAAAADIEVASIDEPAEDKPEFSLTETWRSFQDSLNEGAQSADAIAAQLDEVYLVAEKFAAYSDKDEIQRWSIFISTVNFLGAAEDVANESARNENATTRLIAVVLPAEMSAYDIASYFHGDASRAEEVIFNNPTSNPMLYAAGSTVRLNSDAKTPGRRSGATA